MPTKQKEIEEMKFDLRLLEQKLRRGEIDQKDYEAWLKKLPDDESKGEYIDVYEEPSLEEPTPHAEELTFS